MKVLVTRNKLPLSKLICWGFGDPASHLSLEFDGKIVAESNLWGNHIRWAVPFRKANDVVAEIDLPMTLQEEEAVYLNLHEREGRGYDFLTFFYIGWLIIRYKLLGHAIPEQINDQWANADICTEVAKALPASVLEYDNSKAFTRPYAVFTAIARKQKELLDNGA
jgi:hypothetical protein